MVIQATTKANEKTKPEIRRPTEPHRESRRLVCLSYAAMANPASFA
jgi:hypothetical protein